MKHIIAAILSLAAGVAIAASPYPAGSVTRLYNAEINGTLAGIPQHGLAEAELTVISETNGVTHARVRGRFTDAPMLAGALEGQWSNYIDVYATGFPFKAAASWADGTARVYAAPAADWTTIEIEAAGDVVGLSATIGSTTARLVDTRTNAPSTPPPSAATNKPATGDAIDLTAGWKSLGPHKIDLAKIPVTRDLYSARNGGSDVFLSFEPLGWPTKSDKGKTIDGGVLILWQDGPSFTGGLFDWHGVAQTKKTQRNIFPPELYLGTMPPKGAKLWYCIVDIGKRSQRTNIVPGGTW